MQDYCANEHEQARRLKSYSDKWSSRLKHRSSLVSYHTTKRAQLDVVRIARELAHMKELTCIELQKVIDKYQTHVNEIYVTERFRPGRRHYRTAEFKKSFKTIYAPLREIVDELAALSIQEKKASEAVRTAESACEILELDSTASDKQRARANDVQSRKRLLLDEIQRKIITLKDKHRIAQKIYRRKATDIFKLCQYTEEQRLEHIREILLDFIQAMHSSTYSSDLDKLFQNLTSKITTQQNSFDDVLFWAKSYGIENELTKSFVSTTHDTDDVSDDDDDNIEDYGNKDNGNLNGRRMKKRTSQIDIDKLKTNQHDRCLSGGDYEDCEDEPSHHISSSSSTKGKTRRTKSVTTTERRHRTSTHAATPMHSNTILTHV
jgi:hypothetical protein